MHEQASVHNAAMISFLRPVAFTVGTKSSSSHALIDVRSIGLASVSTSVIWWIVGWLVPVATLTVAS
jgi:hypothetical protein